MYTTIGYFDRDASKRSKESHYAARIQTRIIRALSLPISFFPDPVRTLLSFCIMALLHAPLVQRHRIRSLERTSARRFICAGRE